MRMQEQIVQTNDSNEIRELFKKRGPRTAVSYDTTGWKAATNEYSSNGFKLCTYTKHYPSGAFGPGICEHIPVWKVQKKQGNSVSIGYHCDEHMEQKYRPVTAAK